MQPKDRVDLCALLGSKNGHYLTLSSENRHDSPSLITSVEFGTIIYGSGQI